MGINGRGPRNSMFAGCFLSRSRVRDVSEIQRLVRRAVRGWLLSSNLSVLKTHCRSGLRDKRSMLEALSVCKQVLRRWHEKYIDIERNVLTRGTMAPIARHTPTTSGKMRERRIAQARKNGGPPSEFGTRRRDRRLECGACSASKTCRSVFFRPRCFLFEPPWDSRYSRKRCSVLSWPHIN